MHRVTGEKTGNEDDDANSSVDNACNIEWYRAVGSLSSKKADAENYA